MYPEATYPPPQSARAPRAPKSTSKGHVVRGVAAVAIASLVMRAGGLVAQVVAGYILTAGDFGLFAATLGFSAISAALLSSLRPLFIERLTKGMTVDVLWRSILLILCGTALVLAWFAPQLAAAIGRPDAVGLIRLMAPTLPLQFVQIIGVARLSASFRFEESSKILAKAALLRHAGLVAFAVAGLGVYALILPVYLEAFAQIGLLRRSTGKFPPVIGQVRGVLGRYGATLGWLLLSAVGLALTISGDYLFLSPLETAAVVGFYFFGYQLSTAVTQPFTMAATSVLVPSFASLSNDEDRLQRSFLEAISLLLVIAGLVFGLLAVSAGVVINFVWAGEWNTSVIVVIILAVGTPFRILQPTCYSLLQATANWRRLAFVMAVGAFGAVVPPVAGAKLGGLTAISVGATVGAMFGGSMAAILVGNTIGLRWSRTIGVLSKSSIAPLVGLAATFLLLPGYVVSLPLTVLRVAVYGFAAFPTALALFGDQLAVLAGHIRGNRG